MSIHTLPKDWSGSITRAISWRRERSLWDTVHLHKHLSVQDNTGGHDRIWNRTALMVSEFEIYELISIVFPNPL